MQLNSNFLVCMVRFGSRLCVFVAPMDLGLTACLGTLTHHVLPAGPWLPIVRIPGCFTSYWSNILNWCRGYVGPGGLQKGAQFRNCTGGAARMVDVAIFGNDHIYQRPTPSAVYDTSVAFDPEGSHRKSADICFINTLVSDANYH